MAQILQQQIEDAMGGSRKNNQEYVHYLDEMLHQNLGIKTMWVMWLRLQKNMVLPDDMMSTN